MLNTRYLCNARERTNYGDPYYHRIRKPLALNLSALTTLMVPLHGFTTFSVNTLQLRNHFTVFTIPTHRFNVIYSLFFCTLILCGTITTITLLALSVRFQRPSWNHPGLIPVPLFAQCTRHVLGSTTLSFIKPIFIDAQ